MGKEGGRCGVRLREGKVNEWLLGYCRVGFRIGREGIVGAMKVARLVGSNCREC